MANLRANNLTGTGGRNAIDGSLSFRGYVDATAEDYLKTADLDDYDVGTGDFTFETWIKPVEHNGTNSPNFMSIFSAWNYHTGMMQIQVKNDGKLRCNNNGTIDATGTTILWGNWHHIAFARSGSTIKGFVNGIEEISFSFSSAIDFAYGGAAIIGASSVGNYPGDYPFRGYISNLRLIKGSALYTASFTPPTEKLTAVSGTVLLCCQDSDDATQEATGKTITGYGNLQKVTGDDVNLVSNGHFNSDISGWTVAQGTAEWDSGKLSMTGTSGNSIEQNITTVVGKNYKMSATVDNTGNAGANAGITLGSRLSYQASDSFRPAAKTFNAYWTATSTSTLVDLWGGTSITGKWSNVSVKLDEPPKQSNNSLPSVGVDEGVTFGGETKHNTQGVMYFPTGDTSQRGRGRGVYMVGYANPNQVDDIDYLNIQSMGNTIAFGNLTTGKYSMGSGASSTRGIFCGGYQGGASPDTDINAIEYITIATTGNAADFGDRTVVGRSVAAASSSTRVVMAAGQVGNPGIINTIDYITTATLGNAADFGDLLAITNDMCNACNSPTRGIFSGGNTPGSPYAQNVMQYVTLATTGNAADFGDLTLAGRGSYGGTASSNTRGLICIGNNNPNNNRNEINYVTIATTGNATDFGDLFTGRYGMGSCSNSLRAVFLAGRTPTYINTIDTVMIATTGNASDFGDVTGASGGGAFGSACSDSHGGLS